MCDNYTNKRYARAGNDNCLQFTAPVVVSPARAAPNYPGVDGICTEFSAAVNLFASPSLPPSASSSIYIATFVFFSSSAVGRIPVDGSGDCAFH
jgi:hypothetical protein